MPRKFIFGIIALVFVVLVSIFIFSSSAPKLNADQVVQTFKKDNLEVGEFKKMQASDFGMAPVLTNDAINFFTPSVCEDKCGGRIFAFKNKEDLTKTKTYYEKLGEASGIFASHVLEHENILVQINGEMKQEQVDKYKTSLESIK